MTGFKVSTPTKDRTVGAVEAGLSYRKAAAKFGTTHSKVWRAHQHWKKFNTTHYPKRPGRPRKLDDEGHEQLLSMATNNHRMTLGELGVNVEPNVSRSTVRKELAKDHFHRRKARHKPSLTEKHKEARVFFARNILAMDLNVFNRVIWSDETYITVGGTPGVIYVTRKPNEEFDETCTVPSDAQPSIRLMAWGCIMKDWKGPLVVLEYPGGKGGGMSAERYRDQVLDPVLLPFYREAVARRNIVYFQQDKAPSHKAKATKQWLLQKSVRTFPHPSKSPDLSPIEPCWHDLKHIISTRHLHHPIKSLEELRMVVLTAWEILSLDKINAHVGRMQKALEEVLQRNGAFTRY